ncbi:DUF2905 domain-containing protein [Methylomonas paludis]|uniref:DUF2905 domain-containing protein n=1 Tax=Methylomonas paludis TaxID=1173101 RepID=A0A975RAC6_9GAMM|nr:DUF2905 domain-containing protein [Methylomonas paludis]QWF72335.1 DUF2905 domain-containing protein [Methylomonas paludis]
MDIAKLLIYAGLAIAGIGLILKYLPWLIRWFGKLPGDIRYQSEHSAVFIPFTSMLVISLILTLVINLFFRK